MGEDRDVLRWWGGVIGDRLRGFVGPLWTMMYFVMRGEAGKAGYEFEDKNVNVGEDRLRDLWKESGLDTPISDVMVVWLRNFLVKDKGEWEYLTLESGLLGLFSIHVFLRMRGDNTKACPLARFKGDGDIEWEVDGLDGNGNRRSSPKNVVF